MEKKLKEMYTKGYKDGYEDAYDYIYKKNGLDKEIKELIELKANMDEVIAELTDYITDNYDRLRREIIIETYVDTLLRKETIK